MYNIYMILLWNFQQNRPLTSVITAKHDAVKDKPDRKIARRMISCDVMLRLARSGFYKLFSVYVIGDFANVK